MMLAQGKLTTTGSGNLTPLHKQLLSRFNSLDAETQRNMLRAAAVAAQERLSGMVALARRAS